MYSHASQIPEGYELINVVGDGNCARYACELFYESVGLQRSQVAENYRIALSELEGINETSNWWTVDITFKVLSMSGHQFSYCGDELPRYLRKKIKAEGLYYSNNHFQFISKIPKEDNEIEFNSDFSLRGLSEMQDTNEVDYHFPDPIQYEARSFDRFILDVVPQDTGDYLVTDNSRIRQLMNAIDEQTLRQIRHNIVASNLKADTDQPLSDLFPEDPTVPHLTPDYIDTSRRIVIELTTTNSSEIERMTESFENKKTKYEEILKYRGKCTYFVLVVSTNKVYTNLTLTQKVVDELCLRMRKGLTAEAKIINLKGKDIFRTEEISRDENMIENILRKLDYGRNDLDDENYNKDILFDIAKAELNESEKQLAHMILKETLLEKTIRKPTSSKVLDDYMNSYNYENSRRDMKRICNFPFVQAFKLNQYTESRLEPMYFEESNLPKHLHNLWLSASKDISIKDFSPLNEDKLMEEALNPDLTAPKHALRARNTIKVKLNKEDEINLATTGWGGKKHAFDPDVIANDKKQKMSFHPDVNTDDITEFINSNVLTRFYDEASDNYYLHELFDRAKLLAGQGIHGNMSTEIFKKFLMCSSLVNFADMISTIAIELSVNYKHYTKHNETIYIRLRNFDVCMLVKTTGDHVFCTFGFPKSTSKKIDTGRLGPRIYETENYYITDICSYNIVSLEHYVKASPLMSGIMSHMLSYHDLDVFNMTRDQFFNNETNKNFWTCMKTHLLVYLNNKTDCEEILTSQRYFYMKLMEEEINDPYCFVARLPQMIKSRLTAHFLSKTIMNMHYYAKNPIIKFVEKTPHGNIILYQNIKSFYQPGFISFEKKNDEFYFGYVVSKEKGRGSDKSFQIVSKILKEEYAFRDGGSEAWTRSDTNSKIHRTNIPLLKFYLRSYGESLQTLISPTYKEVMLREVLREFAYSNFSKLATLKASARDTDLNAKLEPKTVKTKTRAVLKEEVPSSFKRRPKMLEAITNLVKRYQKDYNREPLHLFELVPFCLTEIEKKDSFDSDLFPKSQHGGDREIHVLEVAARVLQYFVELISRLYCTKINGETISQPKKKEKFVHEHYSEANVSFDEFLTISKSADATKWCQRHHVSKFAAMLLSITHEILHPLIYRVLRMWTKKRITIPIELVRTFLNNEKETSSNKLFNRMKKDFFDGLGPFFGRMSPIIVVTSGMFQGILHSTSSLFHTVVQEVHKTLTVQAMKKSNIDIVYNWVCGSDDSSVMMSIATKNKRYIRRLLRMMTWKEFAAEHVSIWTSWAKTCSASFDLIEYNSEWYLRQSLIKPTFRWVSAALETSMVEKFIDRYSQFANTLKDCIEGGATTFECSLIQLSQAWLHYKLIGFDNHLLFKNFKEKMIVYPNPTLGFMPLDIDVVSGICGLDFALYCMTRNSNINLFNLSDIHKSSEIEYPDKRSEKFKLEMSKTRLRFTKLSIWNSIVESVTKTTGEMEEAIEYAEKYPLVIFGRHTTWKEDRISILLKLFSPGVKQSLSGHQPLVRMFAASAYLLSRPSISNSSTDNEKVSLLLEITARMSRINNEIVDIQSLFPLKTEYEEVYNFAIDLSSKLYLSDELMVRKSKRTIQVFKSNTEDEYTVMEMVKQKWFGQGNVFVSRATFESYWSLYKLKFPFLKDTLEETKTHLDMNVIQLKEFLESITSKSRTLRLADSSAKAPKLFSTLTRIFWPGKKIHHKDEKNITNEVDKLRSNMFSVLTYFTTEQVTNTNVNNLIRNSSVLKEDYKNLPAKIQRIKLFHDYLNGEEKGLLIDRINRLKLGIVGYFSRRQFKNGSDRVGKGQWVGSVYGIDCVIDFDGNFCTKITLREVNQMSKLGQALRNLLREFKCEFKNNNILSFSAGLLENGQILSRRDVSTKCVPIVLNSKLTINVFDELTNSSWELIAVDQTLRLVAEVTTTNEGSTKVTILNDTLYSKDWDPEMECLISDSTFKQWHFGRPCTLNLLRPLILQFPSTLSFFKLWIKRERNRGDYGNKKKSLDIGTVSHSKFSKMILDMMRPNIILKRRNEIESKKLLSSMDTKQTIKDIDIMNFLEVFESEEPILDWSENTWGEELNKLDFEIDNFEMIDEMMGILGDENANKLEVQELLDMQTRGMPRTNRFFDTFLDLLRQYDNRSLEEIDRDLLNGIAKYPGILGKVFTFTYKSYCIDESDHEQSSQMYEQIVDVRTIDTRESNKDDVKVSELKSQIEEYEKLIGQTNLLSVKQKMEADVVLLKQKLKVAEKVGFGNKLSTLNKKLIAAKLLEEIEVSEIKCDIEIDYSNPEMSAVELRQKLSKTIQQMLTENKIHESNVETYYNSLQLATLTHEYLEIFSESFNVNITVSNDGNLIHSTILRDPQASILYDSARMYIHTDILKPTNLPDTDEILQRQFEDNFNNLPDIESYTFDNLPDVEGYDNF